MLRVDVEPSVLRWAMHRSGKDEQVLHGTFPKLLAWLSGETAPTLKQLEGFARSTYTPIGFFFLREPVREEVPIPDFRTIADRGVFRPSANLLDTVYTCQLRQDWYREDALMRGEPQYGFVGAATLASPAELVASSIRRTIGFPLEDQLSMATWEETLRTFIARADGAGVLVMTSGVVGSNNHRRLDEAEFRGFALVDEYAPLVFINGASSKSAQMFTLAHELAHVWLGQTALSDADARTVADQAVERWCNMVAAELLVPAEDLLATATLSPDESVQWVMQRLARRFKVSTLVVLRRLFDVKRIDWNQFWQAYEEELDRLASLKRQLAGGNFYLTQAARVSKRFAIALVESTLEGRTLYRDAMRLVGVKKVESLLELGRSVGVSN